MIICACCVSWYFLVRFCRFDGTEGLVHVHTFPTRNNNEQHTSLKLLNLTAWAIIKYKIDYVVTVSRHVLRSQLRLAMDLMAGLTPHSLPKARLQLRSTWQRLGRLATCSSPSALPGKRQRMKDMKDMKGMKMAASNEWARQGLENSRISTGRRNQKGQAATDCSGLQRIEHEPENWAVCSGSHVQSLEPMTLVITGYRWQVIIIHNYI